VNNLTVNTVFVFALGVLEHMKVNIFAESVSENCLMPKTNIDLGFVTIPGILERQKRTLLLRCNKLPETYLCNGEKYGQNINICLKSNSKKYLLQPWNCQQQRESNNIHSGKNGKKVFILQTLMTNILKGKR
jgi:hypothetical protein